MLLGIASCSNGDDYNLSLRIQAYPDRTEDFSLWQMPAFFHEIQMGYVLKTDDDKLIIIDGGGASAAPFLKSYIEQLGGVVHTWVVTHAHKDHIGALLRIIENKGIKINRLIHAPPTTKWVKDNEPRTLSLFERYQNTLVTSGIALLEPSVTESLELGKGVTLQVLSIYNPEIKSNAVNNSSLVFRVVSKSKSVLFLGDMGPEGGQKILAERAVEEIRADYVQMAHHGQKGVDRNFYETVGATYALWPTPKWLWENKAEGGGYDSGDHETIIVQEWMSDMGIKKNFVSGLDETVQID